MSDKDQDTQNKNVMGQYLFSPMPQSLFLERAETALQSQFWRSLDMMDLDRACKVVYMLKEMSLV